MTISHRIFYDYKSSGIFYDGRISRQFCDNNLKQIHLDKSCQESFPENYVHCFNWTTQ